MNRRTILFGALTGLAVEAAPQGTGRNVRDRVMDAERAFAASMARRDPAAFAALVSEEAVFLGNDDRPALRGKKAVVDAWKQFFEGPTAPFSWEPTVVEVLDSGALAMTSGPVKNPKGELIGKFTSIWRLESGGQWRVIFDRGCPVCKA